MFSKDRKALIKLITGKSHINHAALSDAELRQQAQRVLSEEALKKVKGKLPGKNKQKNMLSIKKNPGRGK